MVFSAQRGLDMEIGMIGLGKMGGNMALRLLRHGHRVAGFDLSPEVVSKYEQSGMVAADSLEALANRCAAPRRIWMMVPAGAPVDETLAALAPLLEAGDVVIDGGNSDYRNTVRRAAAMKERGLRLVDAGVSGGVWGLAEGYCLMAGGDAEAVEPLAPVFDALACDGAEGWAHVGPAGAGHFAKMVHNGIEYGMMQAYAEGFAILAGSDRFDLDAQAIAEVWRHGSVVRSWLLDLTADALKEDADLGGIAPFVPDSGEGRWTVREAIDLNIPAPVITASLLQRIQSRDDRSFAHRLLSAMRNRFGGHSVKEEDV